MERNLIAREAIALTGRAYDFEAKPKAKAALSAPTIGFEFDINYGASEVDPPPADVSYETDGKKITTHTTKADGFRLKGDGNRIEIGTKPFEVTAAGKKEMQATLLAIVKLTEEFDSLCRKATLHPNTNTAPYKTNKVGKKIVGRPISIYPKYLIKGEVCPVSKASYDIQSIFPIEGQYTYYRQKIFSVGASAQVTMAVPLSKISELVVHIQSTEKFDKSKFPLSGHSKYRLGLRSDAVYKALEAVQKSRRYHIRRKTKLSDGTLVTETNYTKDLEGLVILMVSYLVTGVLPVDSKDYEQFAKAYLPLNVKNHFRLVFADLSDPEKQVFKELYFDGVKQFNVFRLAYKFKPADDILAFGKASELFPAKASLHWSVYTKRPTWFDFIKMIVDNTPLTQAKDFAGSSCSVKSVKGDEVLFVPISKSLDYTKGSKVVLIEMRRLGLRMIASSEWTKLTNTLFSLAEKLNK
ncbi:hypothetical protein [Spirosoma fluminis]